MEVETPSARRRSSSSSKPAAICREEQDAPFAPSQRGNTAKVRILRPMEPDQILMTGRRQRLRLTV